MNESLCRIPHSGPDGGRSQAQGGCDCRNGAKRDKPYPTFNKQLQAVKHGGINLRQTGTAAMLRLSPRTSDCVSLRMYLQTFIGLVLICQLSLRVGAAARGVERLFPRDNTAAHRHQNHRSNLHFNGERLARGRMYSWGTWEATSACTRSCGSGVRYRKRYCYKTGGNVTMVTSSFLCGPRDRDYMLCNTQSCGGLADDFRARQCTAHDRRPYRGRYYRWRPYEQGAYQMESFGPCALVCTANDSKYSISVKFSPTVIDGTPCQLDGITGLCIQSKCVSLGCDKRLHSTLAFDACGVCGGDHSTCYTKRGDVQKSIVMGYNAMITIPPRARDIVVTEMNSSPSVFALRNDKGIYFVNGKHSTSYPTVYSNVGGTTFYYHHPLYEESGLEKMVAEGPTNETLYVMMLSPLPTMAVNVSFHYILPRAVRVKDPPQRVTTETLLFIQDIKYEEDLISNKIGAYNWKPNQNTLEKAPPGLTSVKPTVSTKTSTVVQVVSEEEGDNTTATTDSDSEDFGNSTSNSTEESQRVVTTTLTTTEMSPEVVTSTSNKEEGEKEETETSKYHWKIDMKGACSATCTTGVLPKVASCQRAEDKTMVDDEFCDKDRKPLVDKAVCEGRPCHPRWSASTWSKCSVTCGDGQQLRSVRCYRMMAPGFDSTVHDYLCSHLEKPVATRHCQEVECGPLWEKSEWGECSSKCGHGTQRRDVQCSIVEDCDPSLKPQSIRHCNSGPCYNKWIVSLWSTCSGPCGTGLEQRSVTCRDKSSNLLHDNFCDQSRRPLSMQACGHEPKCPPVWIPQEWGLCSVVCGEGITTRQVVCGEVSDSEFRILADSQCSHLYKPSTRGRCREPPCKAQWYTTEWSACSQTCGGNGMRRRKVNCYRNNKRSLACDTSPRPPSYESCLLPPCSSPPGDTCQDVPGQDCNMVVRVNLCGHPYYKKQCCLACDYYNKVTASDNTTTTKS